MTTYAQLKAFHAVAIERNFHRAAERLHLTQPAISIQVGNLERDSSTILFRRNGHAVSLTEEGNVLYEATRRMFEAEGIAHELLLGKQDTYSRTIHLGADGPHAVLELIVACAASHPDICFRLTMGNAQTTWDNLISLKVDAVVMANAKIDKRVVFQDIYTQDLVALIPSDHPRACQDVVGFEDLADTSLIFREPGSNTQKIVDDALSAKRIQVNPALVLGSREAVVEAVARGLGIGFIFSKELGEDRRYVGIPVQGFGACNVDRLLVLKEQRRQPLVELVYDLAKKISF